MLSLLWQWHRSTTQSRPAVGTKKLDVLSGNQKKEKEKQSEEGLTAEETRVLREFLWKCNMGGHTVETAGTQLGWLNSALYATQQKLIQAPRGNKERGKLKRRVESLDAACRQAHQASFNPHTHDCQYTVLSHLGELTLCLCRRLSKHMRIVPVQLLNSWPRTRASSSKSSCSQREMPGSNKI